MSDQTHTLLERFLDALWLEQGASDNTLAAYRHDLTAWTARLAEHEGTLLCPAPRRCLTGLMRAVPPAISYVPTLGCCRAFGASIAGRL